MGYLDEEGYLYLTDRKNFMIITGGVNVYPAEIEGLLVTHPQVADVAVFGIPNEEYGEEVKAVVQLLNHAEAGDELAFDLIQWAKGAALLREGTQEYRLYGAIASDGERQAL